MKLVVFVLLCFVSISVSAQFAIRGTVTVEATKTPVTNAEVYITNLSKSTTTNAEGNFVFEDVPPGNHTVVVFYFEYELEEKTVNISESSELDFQLQELGETLSEVFITKRKERIFALKQLRDVEGTAIYAGKKSEVVVVDNLTANLAAGNARQIYAQVVGLNIYENNDAGLQLI